MSERILAVLLALAAGLIATGVTYYSPPAGLIAGGVLLALWAWLVCGDVE